jgi:hypothetical protein
VSRDISVEVPWRLREPRASMYQASSGRKSHKVVITHYGDRYRLGFVNSKRGRRIIEYGIWDARSRGQPVRRFDPGEAEALFAYQAFLALEKYLAKCVILGGYGYRITPGEESDLHFAAAAVRILRGTHKIEIPYDKVRALALGGPTGGGLVGGGFFDPGDVGSWNAPVEGMAIASLLNRLASETTINTVIRLQTTDGEVFFDYRHATPDQLQIALSSVFGRLRAETEKRLSETASNDLVRQLEKLGELREKEILSDEEFHTAKALLLRPGSSSGQSQSASVGDRSLGAAQEEGEARISP